MSQKANYIPYAFCFLIFHALREQSGEIGLNSNNGGSKHLKHPYPNHAIFWRELLICPDYLCIETIECKRTHVLRKINSRKQFAQTEDYPPISIAAPGRPGVP